MAHPRLLWLAGAALFSAASLLSLTSRAVSAGEPGRPGEAAKPGSAAEPGKGAAAAQPAEAAAAPAPTVKVTDLGQGERRELRLRIAKGWKEAGVMVSRVEMATEASGASLPPQKMPAPEVTIRVEVTDVSADGDFTYTFQFSEVKLTEEEGVSPLALEAMKSQLQSVKGLTGTATVTSRGVVKKVDMKVPDSAAPRVRQTIEGTLQSFKSFSVPLPEEPVGVGARWDVEQVVESGGLKVNQSTGFELVSFRDDQVRLKVRVKNSGSARDLKARGGPAGSRVSLLSMDLAGAGETILHLQRVLPEKTDLQVAGEYRTRMEIQGQSRDLTTRTKVSTTVGRPR